MTREIQKHVQQQAINTKMVEKHENTKAERQTLIWKIQKYQNSSRFGDFVRRNVGINHTESQLNKVKNEELEDILSKIRIQLDNRNLDSFYNGLIKGGANLSESLLRNYYNIDGFGDELLGNKTFMDALERQKCENPFPSVSPMLQISYALISTAIMTHELNKRKLNPNTQLKVEPQQEMAPLNEDDLEGLMELLGENAPELVIRDADDVSSQHSLETIEEGSNEMSQEENAFSEEEEDKTEFIEIPEKNVGDTL